MFFLFMQLPSIKISGRNKQETKKKKKKKKMDFKKCFTIKKWGMDFRFSR